MTIDNFQPTEVEWCEICRPHISGECDGCHTTFEGTDQRYLSQSHHFHPGTIAGVPGMVAIHKTLCVDCYRKDWRAVYKTEPPDLPDRGEDPNFFAKRVVQRKRQRYAAMIDSASGLTPEEKSDLKALVQKAVT